VATEVKLPRLGQGMEAGTIVKWLKSEGEPVKKGEALYELDTDKVTQEVEADASGVLLKIAVVEGEVEVRQGDRVVATRGPGEYVGEIALLDKRPRTATVLATTPVSVEVLSRREFMSLLALAPELSEQIMATMAQRLADLDAQATR